MWAALPYKDMIIVIGLDLDEYDRLSDFSEVFKGATDGFKFTAYCDFNQKNTMSIFDKLIHLFVPVALITDCAADRVQLIESIKQNGIGMTICPCISVRHIPEGESFLRIRKLFDAGVKLSIASDDLVYMEDDCDWLGNNMILVRGKCGFTDREMLQLQMSALEMFWTGEEDKRVFLDEFEKFKRDRC